MSKVFFPHPVLGRDGQGRVAPKFPLEPAMAFGELIDLLGNSELARHNNLIRSVLAERLHECGYDPARDYFFIAGDPTVLCFMVEVSIAHWGRAPRYLRWNRSTQGYDVCGG